MDILCGIKFPSRLVAIGAAICLTLFAAAPVTAQSCTQIKVTAHPDYAPLAWNTAAGMDGALIRLVERFSRVARIPLTMVPSKTWEEALKRVTAGEVDLILGAYRTPHRDAELLYVDRPIASDPIGVFVRQSGADDIDDLDDLRTLRGAAAAAESFGADFDLRIAKQLTLFRTESLAAAMKFLADKQADYVLSGLYPGLTHLRQLPPGHGIALTQAALIPPQHLYAAFSRASACLSMAPTLESVIERATSRGDMEGLVAEAMARWSQTAAR